MRAAPFFFFIFFSLMRPAAEPDIDFAELVRLAEIYRAVRHDSTAEIVSAWGSDYSRLEVLELRQTRNRCLVGTIAADGSQQIVVRGTANVVNAVYDAETMLVWSPLLGMRVHRGFEVMARALLESVRPHLRSDRPTVLYGHSLGAAEAVLLGLMLEREGYDVRRVYASGQPKITDAQGASECAAFPVLRVSCELDPVPFLPPDSRYAHFGREILLLAGPYYADAPAHSETEDRAGAVWSLLKQTGARTALREHLIASYLEKLRGKEQDAREVTPGGVSDRAAPSTLASGIAKPEW